MKKTDLIKATNELNDLFFEEKDPQRIDTTKSEAKIKSGISEACEMFKEGDEDNLSKATLKVLEDLIDDGIYSDEALHVMENVLGITVPDPDDADEDGESENTGVDDESDDDNEAEETQPEEVEPEDSPDLQEIIKTTKKLVDLKQVVLDNVEFADLEDDLEDYKGFQGLKELRSDMQDLLEEDVSSEEKPVKREKVIPESDSKPEKKETKKAGRPKSEKTGEKKRVTKSEKKEKSKKTGISASYLIRELTFMNPEMTAEEILAELHERGIDNSIASVRLRMSEMSGCLQVLKDHGAI